MILFLTTEKQSGWNKKYTRLDPVLKPESHFVLLNTNTFSLGTCSEPASQVIWRANELAKKIGKWDHHKLPISPNLLVCAVETFETLLFVQPRHSKLYCLCNRDIQNFIVCATETFKTLLFVQPRHSKLYCLCNRDTRNFIVCAIEPFETLLFACPFWGSVVFSSQSILIRKAFHFRFHFQLTLHFVLCTLCKLPYSVSAKQKIGGGGGGLNSCKLKYNDQKKVMQRRSEEKFISPTKKSCISIEWKDNPCKLKIRLPPPPPPHLWSLF